MNRPVLCNGKREDGSNCCWLDNGAKSLTVIDTGTLGEAAEDPTCFTAIQGPILLKLVPKYSFTRNDIGIGRSGNKIPSLIVLKGTEFIHHSRVLVSIFKSTLVALR